VNVVIDASLAIAWTVASQRTSAADSLLRTANAVFVAPSIFAFEVRNALVKAERQQRITREIADEAIAFIANQLTALEALPDESLLADIVALARGEGLSFYDACYLEAASRLSATLASRDAPLLAAAARRNVVIYDAR